MEIVGDDLKGILGTCALAAVILLVGCGGGGGGGGGTSTGTPNPSYQVSIITPSDASQMVDPGSILVGDTLQLEVTSRDTNGNLTVVAASGWVTDAPATVATVSSSGVLKGVGSSGGVKYHVQVIIANVTYSTTIEVLARQNVITGKVRNLSGVGIANVGVSFYDSTAHLLTQTKTARNGTFRGSAPATATRFTIDMSTADPGSNFYYTQFGFGAKEYIESANCLAPLPTPLSASANNPLPDDLIPDLRSLGPPPPPTGCVGP